MTSYIGRLLLFLSVLVTQTKDTLHLTTNVKHTHYLARKSLDFLEVFLVKARKTKVLYIGSDPLRGTT